jgi:hypothetical protein
MELMMAPPQVTRFSVYPLPGWQPPPGEDDRTGRTSPAGLSPSRAVSRDEGRDSDGDSLYAPVSPYARSTTRRIEELDDDDGASTISRRSSLSPEIPLTAPLIVQPDAGAAEGNGAPGSIDWRSDAEDEVPASRTTSSPAAAAGPQTPNRQADRHE